MARKAKRKIETVDLTGSDNERSASQQEKTPKRVADNQTRRTAALHDYSPHTYSQQHSEAERNTWLAEENDEDIDEIFQSLLDSANGSENLILYGTLDTKIVGVRYYEGYATPGEHIMVRREPENPYDSNAIRIVNVRGEQIGHIPRTVASKLAQYIDNRWLAIEGMLSGYIATFDCPLKLRLYGPSAIEQREEMIGRMERDKLPLEAIKQTKREEQKRLTEEQKKATAAKRRMPSSSQPEFSSSSQPGTQTVPDMADLIESSERFSPRDAGQAVEKFGNGEEYLAAMPQAETPDRISTKMLPYQKQALAWLLNQENPVLPPVGSTESTQLWKRSAKATNIFTNIATNFSIKGQEPGLASGGILADDMGLGKTLEMISLIVADLEKAPQGGGEMGATLIISPLSVMSNWSDQIARHVKKNQPLRVYRYHGAGRKPMKPAEFAEYDVVITTYQTLASDYLPKSTGQATPKSRPTGLYSVEWRRIILDEGHIIRNPSSKGAAAVTAVMAESRWVLTGTPIINSLRDLYSLLRFVGITGGLERLEIFNSVLVRPLKGGDSAGAVLLQAIMTTFCLRRRKEMSFVDLRLPELSEYVHRIKFLGVEREKYDALQAEAKGQLQTFKDQSGAKANQAYNHLLETLLRMRQVCNHWQLCGERVSKLMQMLESQKTIDLTPENRKALQDMLQVSIDSHEDCPVCLEALHVPVITHCAHVFGKDCITRVIETQHKCPMCRAKLEDEACLVEPANDIGDAERDDGSNIDLNASSSKLEALVSILQASKKQKGNKTIIFSQWTKFLDIVQARLDRDGFKYTRIDGTMTAPKRDAALHALESDTSCIIMLASLAVCSVGLNLIAANQVILSDSWWAPAIEDQAVDRVHRLGQKKKTTVFRLVMEDSIEERTLEIQKTKRELMMVAFREKSNKRTGGKSARLGDIQKLLE
ncbi:hypothetical protein LTR66_012223 [Elasticomyces elasticus]|nr:hypothetical protein LTR66_012223 [Elasticomyces elasticus]